MQQMLLDSYANKNTKTEDPSIEETKEPPKEKTQIEPKNAVSQKERDLNDLKKALYLAHDIHLHKCERCDTIIALHQQKCHSKLCLANNSFFENLNVPDDIDYQTKLSEIFPELPPRNEKIIEDNAPMLEEATSSIAHQPSVIGNNLDPVKSEPKVEVPETIKSNPPPPEAP